jgi:transglutaminase-like putative cysteine protease
MGSPRPLKLARAAALALAALAASVAGERLGSAWDDGPVLHEPIPPNPREDLAMHVSIDGELPAAIDTPKGVVAAPDPRVLPSATDATYRGANDRDVFIPDRDTRRPTISGYDDPFTPATAPFKRVEAFDAVRADYGLYVRDDRLVPQPLGSTPGVNDEVFYADLVVDLESGPRIRIPSVGPGARVLRARLGVGARDIPMSLLRDGADNWFLQPLAPAGTAAVSAKARLVMEVAAPRGAFGGPIGDPDWRALPYLPPLPDNVARDAAVVRGAIGVSRAMRPRDVLGKLVRYFRAFTDSDDPPRGTRSPYLDLALSKKGVCRHRAFAFVVTAQSLGIPARFVMNEAHAWVEVHDGTMWRRIDLGGAGELATPAHDADRVAYEPPPDPFAWPQGAVRGDDMMAEARARAQGQAGGQAPASSPSRASSAHASAAPSASGAPASQSPSPDRDGRQPSTVSIAVASADVKRGGPLEVHGSVRAAGEACPHLAVELWLRDAGGTPSANSGVLVGTVATDDQGDFAGRVVVPSSVSLGDHDLVARTAGDSRCGAGGP